MHDFEVRTVQHAGCKRGSVETRSLPLVSLLLVTLVVTIISMIVASSIVVLV